MTTSPSKGGKSAEKKATTEPEKAPPQAMVPAASAPLQGYDYAGEQGEGWGDADPSHELIPFIGLLQPMSPIVLEAGTKARPGMLLNTATNELIDGAKGIRYVMVALQRVYTEWTPRDKGGGGGQGFRGIHQVDSDVVKEAIAKKGSAFGRLSTPDETELVETFYEYGVLVDDDLQPIGPVIIPYTSTKIKVHKRLVATLKPFKLPDGRKPPMFAHLIHLTTVQQKNAKGTFYNFVLRPAMGEVATSLLPADSPVLPFAAKLRDVVKSGAAKVDHSAQGKAGSTDGSSDDDLDF